MIVFIGTKRQLARKLIKGLAILLVVVTTVVMGVNYLTQPVPTFNRMTQDEIPSGNPLRVDSENPNDFDRSVEQFVIKLQEFYYEERE